MHPQLGGRADRTDTRGVKDCNYGRPVSGTAEERHVSGGIRHAHVAHPDEPQLYDEPVPPGRAGLAPLPPGDEPGRQDGWHARGSGHEGEPLGTGGHIFRRGISRLDEHSVEDAALRQSDGQPRKWNARPAEEAPGGKSQEGGTHQETPQCLYVVHEGK